jgi:peptidoglycan/xylan/chitin deacetylase (PgdA/CDA1 family)
MRAILTYHSIDGSGSAVSVSPSSFRRQIEWLAAEGVRVVSLAELPALPPESRAVALTFDDGIANLDAEAAPVLQANGMTATVFVVTNRVGKDNRWEGRSRYRSPALPLLGWDELGRLASRGWGIGSHSRTHCRLPGCGDGRLDDELDGSAGDIAAALGTRPRWLAYPYGALDARVAARAAATYELACTTELRPLGVRVPPMRLPRIDAWYLRSGLRRVGWGSPAFRAILGARRLMRAARSVVLP